MFLMTRFRMTADTGEIVMRLKDSFMTQEVDNIQFLVPIDTEDFSGLVRSNPTAAFIVDQLKQETTPETIVDAMYEKYEAPREVIRKDVEEILNTLRRIHAIEE